MRKDLPRIRYVNPKLEIEVVKIPKTQDEHWKPEMIVELRAYHNVYCFPQTDRVRMPIWRRVGDGSVKTLDMDQKWSSSIFQELMEIGGGAAWAKWKEERTAVGLPIVDIPKPIKTSSSSQAESSPFKPDPHKTGAAAVLP